LKKGVIFNIKKYSLHDGPGIRTTVFFKGCPLSCWWCHNPEGIKPEPELVYRRSRCIECGTCISVCPESAIFMAAEGGIRIDSESCTSCGTCAQSCPTRALEMMGRSISVKELMKEIRKDIPFFDDSGGGVTFSGGEPLAQHEFLRDMLIACGNEGIHRAVDTTGFAPLKVIREIEPLTDLFLYDLKVMDPEKHLRYTGVDNHLILSNLRFLSGTGAKIAIRIPVIPEVNDDLENMAATADLLRTLEGSFEVNLLPYHDFGKSKYTNLKSDYKLKETVPPGKEKMLEIQNVFCRHGLNVQIGG